MSGRTGRVSLLAMAAVAATVLVAGASDRAAARASAAASGPSVRSMIVGAGGTVLSPARTITAGSTTVRVGDKSCAVSAGTPLAVLAAVRRAGGPGFALRDYGRCGASPVNSGELFVYSLGGQRNRGQSGWEYKVNGVSGSTGAADESGPRGDGQLLSAHQRVLWFWCVASSDGCERTLEALPDASAVAPGHTLTVTVEGYDNEGHTTPQAGAIVTLGTDFASTGTGGRATLIAPTASGSYQLSASHGGLVPSFPETIVVR